VKSAKFRAGTAAILLLLAGCAKETAVEAPPKAGPSAPLVAAAEKSPHFDAVNSHLELGGTLYGYMDVDGDALDLATKSQQVVHQFAAVQPQLAILGNLDLKALFTDLGLDDIKAVGVSSVREADSTFRNRAFLYTPNGRHGLLAVLGGKPGPFAGIKMAPPDTDFYSEIDFDAVALYGTVRSVVERAAGKEAASSLEKELKEAGAKDNFSALDLIQGFTGRAIIMVRMNPGETFKMPGPGDVKLPSFSAVIRVEGIGGVLAEILTNHGNFTSSKEGSLTVFTAHDRPNVPGLDPVLAVDGKTFYATSSLAFLKECLSRKAGMDTNPEFASGLAALGPQGNGLTWISPRFYETLRSIGTLNPGLNPQQKHLFDFVAVNLPVLSRPLFSVRSNLPDGVLVKSNWNRSLKGDLAMISVYNPVTLGLVAAMAVPAFQKVRQASQQKAVMNNLSLLYGAAEQYYQVNGLDSVYYEQLVGPGKSVKEIIPVAGEDYQVLVFKKGHPLRQHRQLSAGGRRPAFRPGAQSGPGQTQSCGRGSAESLRAQGSRQQPLYLG
jgi:type IV pilus assembly protein PilA